MKRLQQVFSAVLILVGIVHLVVGFTTFNLFTLDASWFLAAGLSIILLGFLNIIFLQSLKSPTYRLTQAGNLLFIFLVGWINYVSLMLPGVVLILVSIGLLVVNWKLYKKALSSDSSSTLE